MREGCLRTSYLPLKLSPILLLLLLLLQLLLLLLCSLLLPFQSFPSKPASRNGGRKLPKPTPRPPSRSDG